MPARLWAGWQGAGVIPDEAAGVDLVRELEAVAQALADWRVANTR
jgi:hypothetical protein